MGPRSGTITGVQTMTVHDSFKGGVFFRFNGMGNLLFFSTASHLLLLAGGYLLMFFAFLKLPPHR